MLRKLSVTHSTHCCCCPPVSHCLYLLVQFRFALLNVAALEAPLILKLDEGLFGDDCIFIANDWHGALVPVYLAAKYRPHGVYQQARSILAVHNLRHQVHASCLILLWRHCCIVPAAQLPQSNGGQHCLCCVVTLVQLTISVFVPDNNNRQTTMPILDCLCCIQFSNCVTDCTCLGPAVMTCAAAGCIPSRHFQHAAAAQRVV